MDILSIELQHTNPSLGPQEEITEVTLSINEENKDKVMAFVQNAKVNDAIPLLAYIEAYLNDDRETLQRILEKGPYHGKSLSVGGTISNCKFLLSNGQRVTLNDVYRKLVLSDFYPEFTSFMVEQGRITKYKPMDLDFYSNPNATEENIPPPPSEIGLRNNDNDFDQPL